MDFITAHQCRFCVSYISEAHLLLVHRSGYLIKAKRGKKYFNFLVNMLRVADYHTWTGRTNTKSFSGTYFSCMSASKQDNNGAWYQ
jgi:hypothetical protein